MNRMQVQLTEEQTEGLKRLASERGVSLAELVRQGVDLVLRGATSVSRDQLKARSLAGLGKFRSGIGDLSARHDAYVAEEHGR